MNLNQIKTKANEHRKKILNIINHIGKGHVGGAFSCIDILSVLYYDKILNISPDNFTDLSRNRFILSKGHASIAQYVILQDLGFFEEKELFKMNLGGFLGEHPDTNIPGIEFISGSLGHGIAVAIGFALNSVLDSTPYNTYVVMGDGECGEGSVWEAASLASHLNLSNLVVIVDRNGLCIHGSTEKINALEPLDKRFESFGWNVVTIDGHDFEEMSQSLRLLHPTKPTAVIANTIKGKGVSFMENKSSWHHGAIGDQELSIAIEELSKNE
jgi:transketolase